MTEEDPSVHYTNPLSLVLLVKNNLIQGWMENRGTFAASNGYKMTTLTIKKVQRLAELNNEKEKTI